jgi:hypothetical protein
MDVALEGRNGGLGSIWLIDSFGFLRHKLYGGDMAVMFMIELHKRLDHPHV